MIADEVTRSCVSESSNWRGDLAEHQLCAQAAQIVAQVEGQSGVGRRVGPAHLQRTRRPVPKMLETRPTTPWPSPTPTAPLLDPVYPNPTDDTSSASGAGFGILASDMRASSPDIIPAVSSCRTLTHRMGSLQRKLTCLQRTVMWDKTQQFQLLRSNGFRLRSAIEILCGITTLIVRSNLTRWRARPR